ncbi:hypothetical protein [Isobaculum melis]|uniref:Prealbumin-like fold domain-containing protein n=1 Tax=Isobaculum melis TaxID=142588 RepID=A0A1H9PXW9_9LACT|nr:hypothetical protein [Isobaculum melis]SER52978.1 hypothetical protein SAMN04488559_101218 [Isobaculum melis]
MKKIIISMISVFITIFLMIITNVNFAKKSGIEVSVPNYHEKETILKVCTNNKGNFNLEKLPVSEYIIQENEDKLIDGRVEYVKKKR